MLFAQMDVVYSALATLGFRKVPIHISETGWPLKGDEDEVGASPDNARKYDGNLIKLYTRRWGLFKPDGTAAYPLGIGGVQALGNSSMETRFHLEGEDGIGGSFIRGSRRAVKASPL